MAKAVVAHDRCFGGADGSGRPVEPLKCAFRPLTFGDVAHDGYDGGGVDPHAHRMTAKLRVADQDLSPKQDFIFGLSLPFKGLRLP